MQARKRRIVAAALAIILLASAAYLWYPRSFSRIFRELDRAADARLYATYYDPIVHPNGKVDGSYSHLSLEHGGEAVNELLDILDGYSYRHILTGLLERDTTRGRGWLIFISSEDWSMDISTNEGSAYQSGLDLNLKLPDGEQMSLTCIAYCQDELIAEVNALLEKYAGAEVEE